MKLNSFLILALGILLSACDDTLTNIGSSIRPDTDDLSVKSASFDLESRTFLADSIYMRTGNPLLGEITDKFYGTIRADYAAQFYAKPGFNFNVVNSSDSILYDMSNEKDSMMNGALDSAVLRIFYGAYVGDSLTPMAVTAYRVQTKLPRNFYSNVDFEPYVTPLESLGSAGYTGSDRSIPDSIKSDSDYMPYVDIKLKDSVKEDFLNAVKNNPSVFKNQETFEAFFPGVYFKNTFGDGTMLRVVNSRIIFFYRTYHDKAPGGSPLVGASGKDSSYVVPRTKYISVTPDVIQLNHVQNPITPNPELLNNDSTTYITAPAGYFTEIDIPVGKIMKEINSDPLATSTYLNGATLNVKAYAPIENIFSATPPSNMLMVERSKMNEFFENNKLPDSQTSFLASYAADTVNAVYQYNFGNLNQLVVAKAEEAKKNGSYDTTYVVKMAVVPISTVLDSYYNITKVSNYFLPGAVALKRGTNPQKTDIVYTIQKVEE